MMPSAFTAPSTTAAAATATATSSPGTNLPQSSSPYITDATKKPTYPYTPQFSPATQMILKRMRGESGGLNSALASATALGAPISSFSQTARESVRQRIIASMASASTVPAPASSPSTAISTLTLPMKPGGSTTTGGTPDSRRPSSAKPGQKRKRGRDQDGGEDASDASSPAEASDYGEGIRRGTPKSARAPTMTKSGRQILKPDTYDPAAAEKSANKSAKLVKRTAEQALCKRCTRMHSPASNQMVFCDKCNDPWHQRCHDPWIGDEVIKDPNMHWYCVFCQPKRERLLPKKKLEQPRFGSWAGRSSAQVSYIFNTYLYEQIKLTNLHRNEPTSLDCLKMNSSTSSYKPPIFTPTSPSSPSTLPTPRKHHHHPNHPYRSPSSPAPHRKASSAAPRPTLWGP